MDYLPVKKIDFASAQSKKKKLDEAITESCSPSCEVTSSSSESLQSKVQSSCTDEDIGDFYKSLSESGTKPAILSVVF